MVKIIPLVHRLKHIESSYPTESFDRIPAYIALFEEYKKINDLLHRAVERETTITSEFDKFYRKFSGSNLFLPTHVSNEELPKLKEMNELTDFLIPQNNVMAGLNFSNNEDNILSNTIGAWVATSVFFSVFGGIPQIAMDGIKNRREFLELAGSVVICGGLLGIPGGSIESYLRHRTLEKARENANYVQLKIEEVYRAYR